MASERVVHFLKWLPIALLLGAPACAAQRASLASTASAPPSASPPAVPPLAAPAEALPAPRFGTVHFAVDCSPAAQTAFDLAAGALHSFFYPETVKLFTRVAELDPGCAMAQWGVAISQLPNPLVPPYPPANVKKAQEAIAKGRSLAATPRARAWLEALEPLFHDADTVPLAARTVRYAQAMARLEADFPDEIEARIFHALALLMSADPHDRTYGRQLEAARELQALAPARPDHPGVTHYLIHAYDFSPIAGQGLAAANAYAQIAPSAPHALHMPSHIYSMLGMWREAIGADRAALAVAREYAARAFPGKVLPGEPHSLDFMENALLQLGDDEAAARVVVEAAAIRATNVDSLAGDTGLAAVPARHALERRDWSEAAALQVRPSTFPYAEAIGVFARAVGAARLGDPEHVAQARAEIDRLEAIRAGYLAAREAYWAEQTEVLVDAASAWLAFAGQDRIAALALLRRAADLEDASEKHVAMENRLLPVRQQLGDLLLALGDADQALEAYLASLKMVPNRFQGLAGAVRASRLGGHLAAARQYAEQLRQLAGDSPRGRAELEALGVDVAVKGTAGR